MRTDAAERGASLSLASPGQLWSRTAHPAQSCDLSHCRSGVDERGARGRGCIGAVEAESTDGRSGTGEQGSGASHPPLAGLRVSYESDRLDEDEVAATPLEQFRGWLADAVAAGLPEPNAMALATVDATGQPSNRHVLLKDVDPRGFVFFTNLASRKARELAANPRASIVFPWFQLHRQVIVLGRAEALPREETAAYFRTRPRASQLGAWASRQSEELSGRSVLEDRYAELDARWPDEVPVPDFWGGLVVRPVSVEFWVGRRSRLHDRLRYTATGPDATPPLDAPGSWTLTRLYP